MLKNLNITRKLGLLVIIMLAAMIAFGWSAHTGLKQVSAAGAEVGHVRLPSILGLLAISEGQTAVRGYDMSAALYQSDPDARQQLDAILEQRRKAWERIDAGWRQYEPLPQTPEETILWNQFQSEWRAWKAAEEHIARIVVALVNNTSPERRLELFSSFFQQVGAAEPLFFRSEMTLEKIVALNSAIANTSIQIADDSAAAARMAMATVALVALTIAAACAVAITRSIVQPLREAVSVARTVAAGDLTSVIVVSGKDETSQLLSALNDMNASLAGIVSRVRASTETISTASEQVAVGSQDLSSRTEEQASSLEETASSMEELTSTVKQNADNARQADALAAQASQIAAHGGEVIAGVVDTMDGINRYSCKIADIIGVIDGIAFQTNILALNAAVEAARAGEQGRGFAVVAGEVRTLAQRSAGASKEIKALINDSVAQVEQGTRLVGDARATMAQVVDSIRRVNDVMSEISTASAEQSSGIEQVNAAVVQMDRVTQQNAALVEEAAAAAESMQDQAAQLAHVVSSFKTNEPVTQQGRSAHVSVQERPALRARAI
ncbi:methyl-accepting chemotaxis protein [Massilia oculi]|uniref:methyl-accepting chemotaxis protein n=1 Tax=Massilia oculi TaxID=945844 RepID=UPI0028AA465D|nr:methyl-accepting chemotaxis protein [Massilia oculi]